MVNQHIKLEGTYGADETEDVVDQVSPASGERITTVGIYFDGDPDTEYSLLLEEQTIMDRIPGDEVPTVADPLQLDLELEEGDTLKLAATDTNSTGTEIRAILLAENTNIRAG